ncbi:hypothetical protein H5A34_12530 [Pectobacterium brasiliense]|uniref:hypothetical protein n=1 Tax=Pectobacterium TaxID=122277 RepID=UPI0001B0E8DB|nr:MULTISPECIES: hypothetical protein [Pectobacterium]ACX87510.1 conserved hypothetical protein [Pectobacterium parmentieri WPP163]MBN3069928.1 hypothetical protein [Pectobacterium brasiliense]MBN3246976.1 hypothetical protein [Pectobacterium brasiliense]
MKCKDIREFFWPILVELTDDEKIKDQKNLNKDISNIKNTDWSENSELALDEAKKLNELESQRRGSADSKAAIYLTAITALTPVLVSLIPSVITNGKNPFIIDTLSFFIFVYAMMNLLRAALWAFNTLKVSASNRVDVADLTRIWSVKYFHKEKLIKENLCAVRGNRDGVNRKVTCIKMTHELLLRTFFSFFILLMIQTTFVFISGINSDNKKDSKSESSIKCHCENSHYKKNDSWV